jgi:hypothetical protein
LFPISRHDHNAAALEAGAATVRIAPLDSSGFVFSLPAPAFWKSYLLRIAFGATGVSDRQGNSLARSVRLVHLSPNFREPLNGWYPWNFEKLGICVSRKRFERSAALEPFDTTQGWLLERLELAAI